MHFSGYFYKKTMLSTFEKEKEALITKEPNGEGGKAPLHVVWENYIPLGRLTLTFKKQGDEDGSNLSP